MSENGGGEPLLSAREVKKYFPIKEGTLIQREVARVHAVDGVSLDLFGGETVGLVGESGCGKSTFGRCVIRLYDLTEGTVTFDGQDITTLSRKQMRPLRREIQMVFQDPYASLNPRKRVGQIIADPMRIHHIGGDIKRRRRSCWSASACRPSTTTAIRTSSRAASGSGSASPARSRSIRS